MRIILASSSPRRQELLALLGLPYDVEPSRFNEPSPPQTPVHLPDFVAGMALEKAREVAGRFAQTDALVIGADTLVSESIDDTGVPLGKPVYAADAIKMLARLSGRTHAVYTGVALAAFDGSDVANAGCCCERTLVTFRAVTQSMIADYVATGEPMDKAGAYGAQGYAAPFIERIEGDFYNVVGLPLCALGKLLEATGWSWWHNRDIMPGIIG